ncbi:amino acid permease [Salinarchaeum sp. Harcht-Bsk1]|uniref:amino acid permease n=1 Tax=Salinarchaeum sp. Harcht-Bsk1 TaxID=1333523 RepID=UPI0006780585
MAEHTRTLDFRVAYAIGLGTMIAAGIFSLSGTAVAEIGASAVIAFVLAAVIAGITAASYSEFASIYSENGGGYLFTSRTFDGRDLLTYGIGMSLFLGYTGTTAFYLATMDEWFVRFIIPEQLSFLPHGTSGVTAAVLLGVLNARGTEESGTFQVIVTGAKVAVLIAFIAGAFSYAGPADATTTFSSQFSTDVGGIVSIAALAFITFFGFSAIAASAGEIIEPRKTVPKAIAASIVTVTILYAFVIVAMTNSPVPAEVVAQEGETAMGRVAEGFLGPIGQSLIVAGAVFSMISASNASILAASGIGSLMGRQGQAPRSMTRIHPDFGTPFWSVTTATATIVAMIVGFIVVFPAHGGPTPLDLGLEALTGFATFNLLLPLAVVNTALILHRRKFPDIERGFRVPGVPVVPILGILANLALITNLPVKGVGTGVALTLSLVLVYLAWGGRPDVEELFQRVREPTATPASTSTGGDSHVEASAGRAGAEEQSDLEAPESAASGTADEDRFRILVPIARPEDASKYVALAEHLAQGRDRTPIVQVLTVTKIPDQTPHEMVSDTARLRADRIEDILAEDEHSIEYTVEGHTCRDVAFDIIQTARNDEVNLILMGYPEESGGVTETVAYQAPCDVVFASGFVGDETFETVAIGAGGGPHHGGAMPMVRALGEQGAAVDVVSVDPMGPGTPEDPEGTVEQLPDLQELEVHTVDAPTVEEGLVDVARREGAVLVIGASRDRRLSQWVFGSTPDRVVRRADEVDVPVLVYAQPSGVPERIEDSLFPVYRYVRYQLLR